MKNFSVDEQTLQDSIDLATKIYDNMLEKYSLAVAEMVRAGGEISEHSELEEVNFNYLVGKMDEMRTWCGEYKVFPQAFQHYGDEVDDKFFSKLETILEDFSKIKPEELKVPNNLGITEIQTIEGSYTPGGQPQTIEVVKENLTFSDILSYGDVSKVMQDQYKDLKSLSKDEQKKYLDELIKQGNIEYEVGWKRRLSLMIDVVPIIGDAKGILEGLIGVDLITGRELSALERGLSFLSIIPFLGDGASIVKGGVKIFLKEFLVNVGAMGIAETANALGMPPWMALIIYAGARTGTKGVKGISDLVKSSGVSTKLDLAKAEFKNVIASKGESIRGVIKSIKEEDGQIKIGLKEALGEIKEITFRTEDLTPYERYVCYNGCFTEETIVITKEGKKKISDIVDGELVLSKDEVSEKIGYKKAERIEKLAEEMIVIYIDNERINSTPDHLFMTSEGFKKARELVIGERIEKSEEGYEIVEKIERESYNNIKVYNLEVEDYHTFYISEREVLVHNEYKNLKLADIYSKYYEGIPDEKLKAEFKSTIEELDKLDPVKNKEIIDNFHASFVGIKNNEAGGIRDILSKVPKVATDFTGKLRGEDITLKDVKTKEISYVKRETTELETLRKNFNTNVRSNFLKDLYKNTDYLKEAGFSDKDILKIQNGRVPDGWQVHHKLPLDDSGTNSFDNLVLIQNEPYHKVITNYQNGFAKQLVPGEVKTIEWPILNENIYPKKH